MATDAPQNANASDPPMPGFPYVTVLVSVLTLFLFVGLIVIAYNSPNYLGEVKSEPKADPAMKFKDVQSRNQAILDGSDPTTRMSVGNAAAEVLTHTEKTRDAKSKYGQLPFPAEPKSTASAK